MCFYYITPCLKKNSILRFFLPIYERPTMLERQAFFRPSQSEAFIQIFHPWKDFYVPIHKNDICPALIEISRSIVEGGVIINPPVRIADSEMRVIKRVRMSACLSFATICGPLCFFCMRESLSKYTSIVGYYDQDFQSGV